MKPTYREKNLLDYLFGGFRSTLNGLKYENSVISVIDNSLLAILRSRESLRSWTARVRLVRFLGGAHLLFLSRSSRSQCHVMITGESGAVFGQNENKGGREDWREKLWLQHAEQQQSALVVEQSHGEEQCVFSPCARYS